MLNTALEDRFTLYQHLPREARIRALNQELAPVTERITRHFPASGRAITTKNWTQLSLMPRLHSIKAMWGLVSLLIIPAISSCIPIQHNSFPAGKSAATL